MTRSKKSARTTVSGFVVIATLLFSASAFAQQPGGAKPGASAPAAKDSGGESKGDYGYKFEDDPLSAGGFGPNDATIRVRPGPVRTTLIRPRTSFVPEMLKSVENI
jgi:hypothetical protein